VATTVRSGLLLAVVALVGAVAVFGVDSVVDGVTDLFGSATSGSELVGDGAAQVLVAAEASSTIKKCGIPELIRHKKCGDTRILLVDANKMPFIARNTRLAWESGRPSILTMNRAKQDANRRAACPGSFPRLHGGQCDEYPMAVTAEGGSQARVEEVPGRENSCQGGSYGAQYPKDGEQFLVVITHPDQIATEAFSGADIAKDQNRC
jgi:hypothetical protein